MADEFQLHELAIEDALNGHQRAKLDRYGDIRFAVLRPARYIEATDSVEFGEVHLFLGPNFVIVIRHAESPDIAKVRHRLEAAPDMLCSRTARVSSTPSPTRSSTSTTRSPRDSTPTSSRSRTSSSRAATRR